MFKKLGDLFKPVDKSKRAPATRRGARRTVGLEDAGASPGDWSEEAMKSLPISRGWGSNVLIFCLIILVLYITWKILIRDDEDEDEDSRDWTPSRQEAMSDLRDQVKTWFTASDTDGSGALDEDEIRVAYQGQTSDEDFSVDYAEIDKDDDGVITEEEMLERVGNAETCTGTADEDGNACTLNSDGDACASESGDCKFVGIEWCEDMGGFWDTILDDLSEKEVLFVSGGLFVLWMTLRFGVLASDPGAIMKFSVEVVCVVLQWVVFAGILLWIFKKLCGEKCREFLDDFRELWCDITGMPKKVILTTICGFAGAAQILAAARGDAAGVAAAIATQQTCGGPIQGVPDVFGGLFGLMSDFAGLFLDELITEDKYNWELPSIATSNSTQEEDELSECILGDDFDRFYKKKCYLKPDTPNPASLEVGHSGLRYEAGQEPVYYKNERDENNRFIPSDIYRYREQMKSFASYYDVLVDSCNKFEQDDCPRDECEWDDVNLICSVKQDIDCLVTNATCTGVADVQSDYGIQPDCEEAFESQRRHFEAGRINRREACPTGCTYSPGLISFGAGDCDQLSDDCIYPGILGGYVQFDLAIPTGERACTYKCRYDDESRQCKTVPKYTLSEEYDFNVRGRAQPDAALPGTPEGNECAGLYQEKLQEKLSGEGGCAAALMETCGAERANGIDCTRCAIDNIQGLSASAGCDISPVADADADSGAYDSGAYDDIVTWCGIRDGTTLSEFYWWPGYGDPEVIAQLSPQCHPENIIKAETYPGCLADDMGDIYGNSGLERRREGLNDCNKDTIKNIVYSSTVDPNTNSITELNTNDHIYGPNQGNLQNDDDIHCGLEEVDHSVWTKIMTTPVKYKVPYCYVFDVELSVSGGGGRESLSNDSASGQHASLEEGFPKRICNPDVTCDLFDVNECNSETLKNICVWSNNHCEQQPCSELNVSGCEQLELDNDMYALPCTSEVQRQADDYCIPPSSGWIMGDSFNCSQCTETPDNYHKVTESCVDDPTVDGTATCILTAGDEAACTAQTGCAYTAPGAECEFRCNDSRLTDDIYRCPNCEGEIQDGETAGPDNIKKCRRGYKCIISDNPDNNFCINPSSRTPLSGSNLQSDICFTGPQGGDYDYWNFGMIEVVADDIDVGTSRLVCTEGPGNPRQGLYNMDRGFSPIIQTMFGTPGQDDNIPFINNLDEGICIQNNYNQKINHDCKEDGCDAKYCTHIDPFDSNMMFRNHHEGLEDNARCVETAEISDSNPANKYLCESVQNLDDATECDSKGPCTYISAGGIEPADCENPVDCWNDQYINWSLKCLHDQSLPSDISYGENHISPDNCRKYRYKALRGNMINLRKFLNINIDENEYNNLVGLTDLINIDNSGVPDIGSIHPCANENAYIEFYKDLQEKRKSTDPNEREEYKKKICKLNGGTWEAGAGCKIGGVVQFNDKVPLDDPTVCTASESCPTWENLKVVPTFGVNSNIDRAWVTAGDMILSQRQANKRAHPHRFADLADVQDRGISGDSRTPDGDNVGIFEMDNISRRGSGDIDNEYIMNHYRHEYGNMLEQLCHYGVQHRGSGDDLSSIIYSPIYGGDMGGEVAKDLCSDCRSPGTVPENFCKTTAQAADHFYCIDENMSSKNPDLAVNPCNDDGSCRCNSFNTTANKWWLNDENKCTTSADNTCGDGSVGAANFDLLYTNDNMNEAVFAGLPLVVDGVARGSPGAQPLCDCRSGGDEGEAFFGIKCDKHNDDPLSCHGQLSEWEFSYDGTDYKKVEYINNKLDLLNDPDDDIFYKILKYLRNRTHRATTLSHVGDDNLKNQLIDFWNNIEVRSKKKNYLDLTNADGFCKKSYSPPTNEITDCANNIWDGDEFTSDKREILDNFPFNIKDILLEIHEHGRVYSPATAGDDKEDYIFPYHKGTNSEVRQTFSQGQEPALPAAGLDEIPWVFDEGRILSPDSLFYHYYRNTDSGPTLCNCTRTQANESNIDDINNLSEVAYNQSKVEAYPISINDNKTKYKQYKSKNKKARWGYRCELETDCGQEAGGGFPIYSSLGLSLPSELRGKIAGEPPAPPNEDYLERDLWRHKAHPEGRGEDDYLYLEYETTAGEAAADRGEAHVCQNYGCIYDYSPPDRGEGGPTADDHCKYFDTATVVPSGGPRRPVPREKTCLSGLTTWNQIKGRRKEHPDLDASSGEAGDDLNKDIDISMGSGRLPDYFDPKGHKPLLCDCSWSLGPEKASIDDIPGSRASLAAGNCPDGPNCKTDIVRQAADLTGTGEGAWSGGPKLGDYCEMSVNQRLLDTDGSRSVRTERARLESHTSWTPIPARSGDGVCNPDHLMSRVSIRRDIDDMADSPVAYGRRPSQTSDYPGCLNAGLGLNAYPGGGACNAISPINYRVENDLFTSRDFTASGDLTNIFKEAVGVDSHPQSINNMEEMGSPANQSQAIFNTEYKNRSIFRAGMMDVEGNGKTNMCLCNPVDTNDNIHFGCNLTSENKCMGRGVATIDESTGEAQCDCDPRYDGHNCDVCSRDAFRVGYGKSSGSADSLITTQTEGVLCAERTKTVGSPCTHHGLFPPTALWNSGSNEIQCPPGNRQTLPDEQGNTNRMVYGWCKHSFVGSPTCANLDGYPDCHDTADGGIGGECP